MPDNSGITSTESVKDAPVVKFDPRIITLPPWITSTSVDLSKRNLINRSDKGSICTFCTSAGNAVLPAASKEKKEVLELSFPKALYDFTANSYLPALDSKISKLGLEILNLSGFSTPLSPSSSTSLSLYLNSNKYSLTPWTGCHVTNIFDTALLSNSTICSVAVKLLGEGFSFSRVVIVLGLAGTVVSSTSAYLLVSWITAVIVYSKSFFSSMETTR